ncbi:uncharacterized protein LOC113975374 isoform X1 [Neopelma chrysocephalum]|uniref:uncharacterized protein LOC113975374 isoform X1 n=1 Tax=Neopelma chrysocephalum TaxID=114329 RepID=UPI000FCD16D7|nr:uncharacterized protein LOC113975374 isoform X1 [Neopelma chrysocephalum]
MLGTLMTALFFVVRVVRQVSPAGIYCFPFISPLSRAALPGDRERRQWSPLNPGGNGLLCLLKPWLGGLGAPWALQPHDLPMSCSSGWCQEGFWSLVMRVEEQQFLLLFPFSLLSPYLLQTLLCVQLETNLFREEPLPYLVYQPLPWQIQCVSQSRRTSRDSERGRSSRHNSVYSLSGDKGDVTPDASKESKFFSDPSERAAITIQTHFRRYQQQKQEKK